MENLRGHWLDAGHDQFSGSDRHSRTAAAAATLGLPVSAVAGTRLALEPGHGRSATPVRSAIVGLTLAVTAMVAAFGFAASMDRFTSSPDPVGIRSNFATGHPFIGDVFQNEAIPIVLDDPDVVISPWGTSRSKSVWSARRYRIGGGLGNRITEGRPNRPHDARRAMAGRRRRDVAVGLQTARALGVSVG